MTEGIGSSSKITSAPDVAALAFEADLLASDIAVRDALIRFRVALRDMKLGDDLAGSIEIAAAEALNNITEHSYSGTDPGPIRMTVYCDDSDLYLKIVDEGDPLPGNQIPPIALPDTCAVRSNLPEGGFGWYMIGKLSDAVTYRRYRGRNHLLIHFALAQRSV